MTPATLRRIAVDYTVKQIMAETDWQQIEWNLLNLDDFKPLLATFDGEDLYDEISDIMSDANDKVEDEQVRNAERWEEYSNQYPELDDVMQRER